MVFIEKEIKILNIDLSNLIVKLETLGAKRTTMGSIHDTYYDISCKDNTFELEKQRKRIRLRKSANEIKITMKQRIPSDTMKSAIEHEHLIGSEEEISRYLTKKGLTPSREKYKTRIAYKYGNLCFDIDLYPGIPPLLEIEGPSREAIQEGIRLVGLDGFATQSFGAKGLFKRYKKAPLRSFGR